MNSTPTRIEARFAALKQAGKKAFITYTTAGYPNMDIYAKLLEAQPEAGVDLIEIGVPFSDPVADGPTIQAAGNHALKEGTTLPKILEMVRTFRETDNETPIILMGYYNPIYSYGMMRFLDDAKKCGVDGFIIPDLPPEEDEEFRVPATERGLCLTRLVTPTTDANRLPVVIKDATGFLYYVSIAGITGSASAQPEEVKKHIDAVRAMSPLPIAVGFGVNTAQQAHDMAAIADGVIVGSAIIKRIGQHMNEEGRSDADLLNDVTNYIRELAVGAHG